MNRCATADHALTPSPSYPLTLPRSSPGSQVTADVVDSFLRLTGLDASVMQPAFGMAETATCVTYCTDFGGGTSRLRLRHVPPHHNGTQRLTADGEATSDQQAVHAPRSFIDLGPPVAGVELRIVSPPRGDGTPRSVLKELQVGHVQIRGACVMRGYHDHPAANAECMVGDGWLDSGDLGLLHRGRLVLTGRAKEV